MSEFIAAYERILLEKLKNDDQSAFTIIFTRYYNDLVRFSFGFTHDVDASEEIVQDVFLKLWENRKTLYIQNSLKSFLLKSVQNRSLDRLRHLDISNKYVSMAREHPLLVENDTENYILHSELEKRFNQALEKIPAVYAEAFRMSRVEFLNYQEISVKLGISVRTVEVRMSKALNLLREELKDFLVFVLMLLHLFY